jgi:putative hemolysin
LSPLSHLAGLNRCAELYARLPVRGRVSCFAENALAKLGVGWSVVARDLETVPRQGATVVVANHPYGGLEGLVLMAMLRRVRPDIKVLANHMLCRVPEMREFAIPVDPFNNHRSRQRNVSALRKAYDWLQHEGLIVIFPAGEVSHFHLRSWEITDPAWQPGVGRLIRRCSATVVPIFFDGHNGLAFQLAGLVHPRLRTLLLPRQLLNKAGQTLNVRVGEVIPASRFKSFASAEEVTAYLRLRTYLLAGKVEPPCREAGSGRPLLKQLEHLAEACPTALLVNEISTLPEDCLLYEQGKNQVWCVEAGQAPSILREIGRLRELTFRMHAEGTGRSLDLDRFDDHYRHLFVWNSRQHEIVGAYRIGLTDVIVPQHGLAGLYTNTLFNYHEDLFNRVGPALEMGRSFVRPEYQKSFTSLLLLWQGIGRFLLRHPKYRVLFGPVSIAQSYSDFSRQLMTSTLFEQLRVPELSRFVAPRLPVVVSKPRVKGCPNRLTKMLSSNLEAVDSLLADIEADGKGLPVLLRHYLNLGGRMLAFNLDRDFSNVIDGLVLVDLDQTPKKTLGRYMGKEGVEQYLAYAGNRSLSRVA